MTDKLNEASLIELKNNITLKIEQATSTLTLDEIKVYSLGKNGILSDYFKAMASLSTEDKKRFGVLLNSAKLEIDSALQAKYNSIRIDEVNNALKNEKCLIEIPSNVFNISGAHLITKVVDEVYEIFKKYGFDLRFDREIEEQFYNFDSLNFPKFHPAREMQDSFFVDKQSSNGDDYVLRTHTSSVQIRTMTSEKPPFRFLSTGRTYRNDFDKTHTPMFNQVEGLCVDKGVSMANLKFVIEGFLKEFFESDEFIVRFRPSFFPFTEPSAEVDIGIKSKTGIKYLEVMGCGMVHPNVLSNCNIDPTVYTGFAFGMGVERLAMLKYGVADLREFFEGKSWWLNTYSKPL